MKPRLIDPLHSRLPGEWPRSGGIAVHLAARFVILATCWTTLPSSDRMFFRVVSHVVR